jgi:hypothetical protein
MTLEGCKRKEKRIPYLLMKADDIGSFDGFSGRIIQVTIKVFDTTQAVAPKGQVIRRGASTRIPKIEGLSTVLRRAWIYEGGFVSENTWNLTFSVLTTVRNRHLTHAQSVEELPPIISDIMNSHTLPPVESDSESPFLPRNPCLIFDCEAGTFRL